MKTKIVSIIWALALVASSAVPAFAQSEIEFTPQSVSSATSETTPSPEGTESLPVEESESPEDAESLPPEESQVPDEPESLPPDDPESPDEPESLPPEDSASSEAAPQDTKPEHEIDPFGMIDTTRPKVTSVTIDKNAVTAPGEVKVMLEAEDKGSGIGYIVVYFRFGETGA